MTQSYLHQQLLCSSHSSFS